MHIAAVTGQPVGGLAYAVGNEPVGIAPQVAATGIFRGTDVVNFDIAGDGANIAYHLLVLGIPCAFDVFAGVCFHVAFPVFVQPHVAERAAGEEMQRVPGVVGLIPDGEDGRNLHVHPDAVLPAGERSRYVDFLAFLQIEVVVGVVLDDNAVLDIQRADVPDARAGGMGRVPADDDSAAQGQHAVVDDAAAAVVDRLASRYAPSVDGERRPGRALDAAAVVTLASRDVDVVKRQVAIVIDTTSVKRSVVKVVPTS